MRTRSPRKMSQFFKFLKNSRIFWREMEVLSAWDKIHQVIESTIAEKINDTKKGIRENLARAKNFEIKFRVIFYCNDRHFISRRWGGAGRQDMFPPNSEIFLISPSFLWFYILSRSATGEATQFVIFNRWKVLWNLISFYQNSFVTSAD